MWRFLRRGNQAKKNRTSPRNDSRNRRLGFEKVEARTMLSANTISLVATDNTVLPITVSHGMHPFETANTSTNNNSLIVANPIVIGPVTGTDQLILDTSVVRATGGESITYTLTILEGSTPPGFSTPFDAATTATGTVTFMDGSTVLGTGTVKDGVATFTTSSLAAGNYSITAVYSGDSNFAAGSSNAVAQSIASTATITTVGVSKSANGAETWTATIGYANSVGWGPSLGSDNLGVTEPEIETLINPAGSTAQQATGTVTFLNGSTVVGTATVVDGVATLTIASPTGQLGSYSATYSGNNQFQASQSGVYINPIFPISPFLPISPVTTTVLDTSVVKATGGESITYTATILQGDTHGPYYETAPPFATTTTGTVTFINGSTVLGTGTVVDGVATFTTSSLAAGNYSITAVYSGDKNFDGGTSNAVAQSIASTATTTTVGVSKSASGAETWTATIQYANDVDSGPGFGSDNLNEVEPAIVTLVNPAGSTAQQATGTVTFFNGSTVVGTATVVDGVATLTIASPTGTLGSYSANYSGNDQFQANQSGTYIDPILPISSISPISPVTTTVLDTSVVKATGGESITYTATILQGDTHGPYFSGPPFATTTTGTVTFINGSTVLGTGTVVDGVATFTTSSLAAGNYSITAVYSGDKNFDGGTSNAVAQSIASTATTTTVGVSKSASGAETWTATIQYANDVDSGPGFGSDNLNEVEPAIVTLVNPAGSTAQQATGTVTFFNGSTVVGTASVVDGVATLTIASPTGTLGSYSANYSGNDQFQANQSGAYITPFATNAAPTSATNFMGPINFELAVAANSFSNGNTSTKT